jgi:hypothetical protein
VTNGIESVGGGRDDLFATLWRAGSWLHRDRFVPVTANPNGPVAARDGAYPICEAHGVAHTGKLARSIILDLAVHDAFRANKAVPAPNVDAPARRDDRGPRGRPRRDEGVLADRDIQAPWRRAVARARWVVSRLGTDPEHGGRIFLPGRLDPRNNSTSLIDAGECVDALATLALHPGFGDVADAERQAVMGAMRECSETYLAKTITSKAIVNQVLWGAMGLAHACSVFPGERAWRDAVVQAIALGVDRQRPDGSWGYESPSAHQHPGVADLTVYYHGRCLAFLRHALDHVPEADTDGRASTAFRRGVEFLVAVRAPDGRKSLALEGKRWFWASTQEVGSLAYDIHALARAGLEREPWGAGLIEAAWASWQTLRARIDPAGAVRAGDDGWPLGDAADVICRDFHVADLAWVARSLGTVDVGRDSSRQATASSPGQPESRGTADVWDGIEARKSGTNQFRGVLVDSGSPCVRRFDDAGVVRLEVESAVAVLRVAKAPNNSQWGGAIGGGTIVVTRAGASVWRDAAVTPGSLTFSLASRGPTERMRSVVSGMRRFVAMNQIRREGRQVAFNLRVMVGSAGRHLRTGHPEAAARLLIGAGKLAWRMVGDPFFEALEDVATTHWSTDVSDDHTIELSPDGGARIAAWSGDIVPARRDGSVPGWGRGVRVARRVRVDAGGVQVSERIDVGPPSAAVVVTIALPEGATQVCFRHGATDGAGHGAALTGAPDSGAVGQAPGELGTGWRVWQGGALMSVDVRPRPASGGSASKAGGLPRPAGHGRRPEDGMNDGTLEVAYRLDC